MNAIETSQLTRTFGSLVVVDQLTVAIPVMAVFVSELSGVQLLGPLSALIVAVVLAILAGLAIWGSTRIFQREVILTRWK